MVLAVCWDWDPNELRGFYSCHLFLDLLYDLEYQPWYYSIPGINNILFYHQI